MGHDVGCCDSVPAAILGGANEQQAHYSAIAVGKSPYHSQTRNPMTVELTRDELGIINNALNEVCNGIHLEGEFDTRMGCDVEEARTLLAKIHALASDY
jgi:hypothetical protein